MRLVYQTIKAHLLDVRADFRNNIEGILADIFGRELNHKNFALVGSDISGIEYGATNDFFEATIVDCSFGNCGSESDTETPIEEEALEDGTGG